MGKDHRKAISKNDCFNFIDAKIAKQAGRNSITNVVNIGPLPGAA